MQNKERISKFYRAVFTAEILVLIGQLLEGAAVGLLGVGAAGASAGFVVVGLLLVVVCGIIALVGAIMRLVVLARNRDLNNKIAGAFAFTVIVILLVIVNSILQTVNSSSPIADITDRLSSLLNMVVAIYLIFSVKGLAEEFHNEDLAESAQKTGVFFTVLAVLSAMSGALMACLDTFGAIAAIAFLVFTIIAYVRYLKLLKRASIEL